MSLSRRARVASPRLSLAMASTALEQARASHERVERLERAIASEFKTEAVTHKARLAQSHRVNRALDEMVRETKRLRSAYADEDGAMREELAGMRPAGEDAAYAAFYARLRDARASHEQRPGALAPTPEEDVAATFHAEVPLEFSGEEASGRYLDLHALHHAFTNAPFGRRPLEYVAFLANVRALDALPRDKKFSRAYADYLDRLLAYLRDFHRRVKPLVFAEKIEADARREFERDWPLGEVPGWADRGVLATDGSGGGVPVPRSDPPSEEDPERRVPVARPRDLDKSFASADAMADALGEAGVKASLRAAGLKQGGTAEQRRDRLWSVRGKAPEQIDEALFAKGAAACDARRARFESAAKAVASKEALARAYLDHHAAALDATKGNVEKRATLSLAELEAEAEEDDDFVEEEEEDAEEEVYNPLRLPLGWDGKPIPYWLYKLHGLNLEFTCEICGNYSYWGRRAYERHFSEHRHQHGMKCLKIPNTKAFAEVRRRTEARREKTSFFFSLFFGRRRERTRAPLASTLSRRPDPLSYPSTFRTRSREGMMDTRTGHGRYSMTHTL